MNLLFLAFIVWAFAVIAGGYLLVRLARRSPQDRLREMLAPDRADQRGHHAPLAPWWLKAA